MFRRSENTTSARRALGHVEAASLCGCVTPSAAPVKTSRYVCPAGRGGSEAFLAVCEDGIARVIKAPGNPQTDRVLVNELVVSRLAPALGAPCPGDAAIVLVTEPVLADAKKQSNRLGGALPGLGFGCHWYDVSYGPGAEICKGASNRGQLINLVTLYLWVRNHDFKADHLLYRTLSDGAVIILGFDHGHCFGNPTWDTTIEQQASKAHNLPRLSIDEAIEASDVSRGVRALEAVSASVINDCTENVPPEWGVPKDELGSLNRFLVASRPMTVSTLNERYAGASRRTT